MERRLVTRRQVCWLDAGTAQQLIEDELNKLSAKHANKSTLVARDADAQLWLYT